MKNKESKIEKLKARFTVGRCTNYLHMYMGKYACTYMNECAHLFPGLVAWTVGVYVKPR